MKAFILAAGLGNRLRPLTQFLPKPLVEVAGIPLIEFSRNLVSRAGCNFIAVNTHYLHEMLEAYLIKTKTHADMFISHEPELLDTGGGLKKCESHFRGEAFVLANSDIIADLDIQAMIDLHRQKKASATLMLVKHENASGIAPITLGPENIITDINRTFSKQADGQHLYGGIAILEPEILDYIPQGKSALPYTGFTGLIKAGKRMQGYVHEGTWFDCGNFQNYFLANKSIAINREKWAHFLGDMSLPISHLVNQDNMVSSVIPPDFELPAHCMLENCIVYGNARLTSGKYSGCIFQGNHIIQADNL